MAKLYSVYVHTCPNGKKYVGITSKSPEERWVNGQNYRGNVHFSRAIKKFGWKNIIHDVMETNISEEEAAKMEVKLIEMLNTMNHKFGYNNTTGGEVGKEYSEESIKKMSENRKNIYCGKEHYCFGKTQEEIFGVEGAKKSLEKARVRWSGGENPQKKNPRRGVNHPLFGKKIPVDVIEKMKRGRKNRKIDGAIATEIVRRYYCDKLMQKDLSEEYGIARQTVGDLIHGKIYKIETEEIRSIYERKRERHG